MPTEPEADKGPQSGTSCVGAGGLQGLMWWVPPGCGTACAGRGGWGGWAVLAGAAPDFLPLPRRPKCVCPTAGAGNVVTLPGGEEGLQPGRMWEQSCALGPSGGQEGAPCHSCAFRPHPGPCRPGQPCSRLHSGLGSRIRAALEGPPSPSRGRAVSRGSRHRRRPGRPKHSAQRSVGTSPGQRPSRQPWAPSALQSPWHGALGPTPACPCPARGVPSMPRKAPRGPQGSTAG